MREDDYTLKAIQPGLRHGQQSGKLVVEGELSVALPGSVRGEFTVQIRYPGTSPFQLPDVYDVDGRFDRAAENHVEATGRFCMWLPLTAPVADFQRPGGLARYLDLVCEFVRLQVMYEERRMRGVEPHWPWTDWEHGGAGYEQWFRENSVGLVPDQLEKLIEAVGAHPRRAAKCPCGSGKKLGNCHKKWLATVRRSVRDDPTVLTAGYVYLNSWRESVRRRST
ncbi:SEC-C metal-binding domain-containing protein [Amycolatopsis sp. NPDC024027]|uniref:SEC-C metal-binding domain-containing protein n=1 Tax=Amycolatopsis sp. NPDC024027 TaxID=3154327 RepID=UPI0033F31785